MSIRRTYRLLLTSFSVMAFTASLTMRAYAYEYSEVPATTQYGVQLLQRARGGESIRQVSPDWPTEARFAPTQYMPQQAWAGDSIRQASINWADHAEGTAIAEVQQHAWDGDSIRQASLNWADHVEESAVAVVP